MVYKSGGKPFIRSESILCTGLRWDLQIALDLATDTKTLQRGLMKHQDIHFENADFACQLFGPGNAHLDLVAQITGVRLESRGSCLSISGQDEHMLALVSRFFAQAYALIRAGHKLFARDVEEGLRIILRDPDASLEKYYREAAFSISPRKTICPRTVTQREYLHALRTKDLTLGIGPAGTGKTYLAVAVGVSYFLQKKVKRLILTRPAVEAGEKLGFLPGDLVEKVNPYLRPLYDALHDMFAPGRILEMIESETIEIAPLAFMRGRTLNNAFIILDEAQNTSPEQMKMFLTRLGYGSRAVVTGDVTQIDLPRHMRSGLVEAVEVLAAVPGVDIVQFSEADVIRHPLVGQIVNAYEQYQQRKAK